MVRFGLVGWKIRVSGLMVAGFWDWGSCFRVSSWDFEPQAWLWFCVWGLGRCAKGVSFFFFFFYGGAHAVVSSIVCHSRFRVSGVLNGSWSFATL